MKIEEARRHLERLREQHGTTMQSALSIALWLMDREHLVGPAIFGNNVDARQALQDWGEDHPSPID